MTIPRFKLHDTAGFPAFPFVYNDGNETQVMTGLTTRQYMATAALQGLLARAPMNDEESLEGMSTGNNDWPFTDVADVAVKMADALIERLNK